MKIYFAGPLFTPYVRQFISQHAQILRDNGIEPFVPHESFRPALPEWTTDYLLKRGLLNQEDLQTTSIPDLVWELVLQGRLRREDLGLPSMTPEHIFGVDYAGLASSNAIVALLDGTQVDDGTACEIGIFYGLLREDPSKKGILGFMTDFRALYRAERGYGLNLFVLGVIEECGKILADFDEVVAQLKAWDAELRASQ